MEMSEQQLVHYQGKKISSPAQLALYLAAMSRVELRDSYERDDSSEPESSGDESGCESEPERNVGLQRSSSEPDNSSQLEGGDDPAAAANSSQLEGGDNPAAAAAATSSEMAPPVLGMKRAAAEAAAAQVSRQCAAL
jgi:hypothetical protein